MPYKNKEARKTSQKNRVRQKRGGIDKPSEDVEPLVYPKDPRWQPVIDYITRPSSGMPNLERLQRIAGSLGKYADQVWFGGLLVKEIGDVIGTKEGKYER